MTSELFTFSIFLLYNLLHPPHQQHVVFILINNTLSS